MERVGPEGKEMIGGFIANKMRQIGVDMATKKHQARERREIDEYKQETRRGPHICQEVLESAGCDIMNKGVLYMGV